MDQLDNKVDTTDPRQKWRFKCPECSSTNWRVHNGTFGCRSCRATVNGLVDDATGEFRSREWFDFVGTYADDKGENGKPPGVGRYR